jgi:aspartate/methionine/tyrosine aminotransferase
MVQLALADPIIVPTTSTSGYRLTATQLRQTLELHPHIKLLILCNPSNPTGGVYGPQELQALCKVLMDFPHVRVLSDEIYERLVYSDHESDENSGDKDNDDDDDDQSDHIINSLCPAMAAQPGMWERTITINGFSKAYAMTGFRLGYVAAPPIVAKAISVLQSQFTSCASSISQAAGVAALTKVSSQEMQLNRKTMYMKRNFVLEQLSQIPNCIVSVPPTGAFYVLPDISFYCSNDGAGKLYQDDITLCMDLLEQERLALVPGSSFGAPGTVRISYATSMEELTIAMQKLHRFLSNLHEQMKN